MMKAYRLIKSKWKSTAFDGEGSRLYGGRWNSAGKPCVYLAEYESLGILEALVHVEDQMALDTWCLFELSVDENELLILPDENLPLGWHSDPAPPDAQRIGDEWLESNSSLGIILPSAVARRDRNIMVNIAHPKFLDVLNSAIELEFWPDKRLTKKSK